MRDETITDSTLADRLKGHEEQLAMLVGAISSWMDKAGIHTLTVKRTGGKTTMTMDAREESI